MVAGSSGTSAGVLLGLLSEKIQYFRSQLSSSERSNFRENVLFLLAAMFLFLACFRGSHAVHFFAILLFQLILIFFQLSFEAEIGKYCWSVFSHKCYSFLKGPLMFFHDVGYH